MKLRLIPLFFLAAATTLFAQTNAELKEQVRAAERAFAKTMADRDHAAFISFLADEAVFFGNGAQRGADTSGRRMETILRRTEGPVLLGARSSRGVGVGNVRAKLRPGLRSRS